MGVLPLLNGGLTMARNFGNLLLGAAASDMETTLNGLPTSSPLFIVNGTMDLTNFIVVPSYQVNLLDGYEEWTDNNKVTHRDIISKKASGSFSLKFENLDQYQAFLLYMANNKKQNGSYDCTVYFNNTLSSETIEMFIDFEPANVMPYVGVKDYDAIEVTVEQRGNQYVPSS